MAVAVVVFTTGAEVAVVVAGLIIITTDSRMVAVKDLDLALNSLALDTGTTGTMEVILKASAASNSRSPKLIRSNSDSLILRQLHMLQMVTTRFKASWLD